MKMEIYDEVEPEISGDAPVIFDISSERISITRDGGGIVITFREFERLKKSVATYLDAAEIMYMKEKENENE